MKILITGTSFDMSYGGPAVSVAGLAGALSAAGAQVGIWAPDGSAMARTDLADSGVRLMGGTLSSVFEIFSNPDVVHDNGIWLPHNHNIRRICGSLKRPRIVSPRGMLDPWSRSHKKLKKTVAWHAYQKNDIHAARRIHLTSDAELINLKQIASGLATTCIPNGIPVEPLVWQPKVNCPRLALFLGRLHPVKGIDLLFSAWAAVRPPGWRLIVAGPNENNYQSFLTTEAARLEIIQDVEFMGPVTGDNKKDLLRRADLFILPSRSESFGMAIAEAFGAGLPVITTTSAPWEYIVKEGCGWRVTPNKKELATALYEATSTDRDRLALMGSAGYNFVRRTLDWRSLAPRYLSMYHDALAPRK